MLKKNEGTYRHLHCSLILHALTNLYMKVAAILNVRRVPVIDSDRIKILCYVTSLACPSYSVTLKNFSTDLKTK